MGQRNQLTIETTGEAVVRPFAAARRRGRPSGGRRNDSIPSWWRNARR